MKPLRSATVFRLALPPLDALEDHLKEVPFHDPDARDIYTAGFVPTPTLSEGELATSVLGATVFCLRVDEKVVPGGVVLAEIQKRVEAEEEELGFRVGRKRRSEIKEVVLADLYARALVRTSYTPCFYCRDSQLLIVPTTSAKATSLATKYLLSAVGAIESRTIHIDGLKGGLTTRLDGYLRGDEAAFAPFELLSSVWLEGLGGQKVAYQLSSDLEAASEGIQEALTAGFQVSAVQLSHTACDFRLTSDFRFKSIDAGEKAAAHDFETEQDRLRHDLSTEIVSFEAAVKALMDLFGYKEGPQE